MKTKTGLTIVHRECGTIDVYTKDEIENQASKGFFERAKGFINKNFLVFVFILLGFAYSNAQGSLVIDNRLEPLMFDYVEEAKKRGLDIRPYLIEKIDYISYTEKLPWKTLGVFLYSHKAVFISERISFDDLAVKVTLFHEVGHALTNKNHVCKNCGDIMSEFSPDTFGVYYDKEQWQKHLDKYFEYIKNNLNEVR